MSIWVRLCVYNYVTRSIVYCVCMLARAYMLMGNVRLYVHANMYAFARLFFKFPLVDMKLNTAEKYLLRLSFYWVHSWI